MKQTRNAERGTRNREFLRNLSQVLAHTLVLESGRDAVCEAFAISILAPGSEFLQEEPKVPKFIPINAAKEQGKAVAGNVANFDSISKLAGSVNTFNQGQLTSMIEAGAPGYSALMGSIRGRANDFLSGDIPADVQAQIGRNAAYKSLSGGYGGSGMARDLVARDLGLTSLDLIGKGIDAGSRWAAQARGDVAGQFNPASMFITPEQQVQTTMFNRTGTFQRNWMKNQLDAQYDPMTIFSKGAERDQAMWDSRANSL